MQNKLLVLFGPSGSGKFELARKISKFLWGRSKIECEFVNANSNQFYKGMDIGTSKISPELQAKFPTHLIDFLTPNDDLDPMEYKELAEAKIQEIWERNHIPILIGGSGSTVLSVIGDQFLKLASKPTGMLEMDVLLLVPAYFRPSLYKAIERNVDTMFNKGLYEELIKLLDEYSVDGAIPFQLTSTLGYKEFFEYCKNYGKDIRKLTKADLGKIAWKIKANSKTYAMHQDNWLKKLQDYSVAKDFDKTIENITRFIGQ